MHEVVPGWFGLRSSVRIRNSGTMRLVEYERSAAMRICVATLEESKTRFEREGILDITPVQIPVEALWAMLSIGTLRLDSNHHC